MKAKGKQRGSKETGKRQFAERVKRKRERERESKERTKVSDLFIVTSLFSPRFSLKVIAKRRERWRRDP